MYGMSVEWIWIGLIDARAKRGRQWKGKQTLKCCFPVLLIRQSDNTGKCQRKISYWLWAAFTFITFFTHSRPLFHSNCSIIIAYAYRYSPPSHIGCPHCTTSTAHCSLGDFICKCFCFFFFVWHVAPKDPINYQVDTNSSVDRKEIYQFQLNFSWTAPQNSTIHNQITIYRRHKQYTFPAIFCHLI